MTNTDFQNDNGGRLPPRDAARKLEYDKATAEAVSRKNESKANLRRSRMARGLTADDSEDAFQRERESAEAANELAGIEAPIDLEGTRAPMADRAGNFAANAAVATTGGIGVDASNTVEGGTEQAQTPQEAGTIQTIEQPAVVTAGAKIAFGNQRVDNPDTPGDESLEIPEGWRDQSYLERRRLATGLTGNKSLRSGEEVDAAIEAEENRRRTATA